MRTRNLLLVVALSTIPLATWARIEARRDRFRRLADDHRSRVVCMIRVGMSPGHHGVINRSPGGEVIGERQVQLDLWHLGLSVKYREAAEHPWLPVPPDGAPPDTAAGGRSSAASPEAGRLR